MTASFKAAAFAAFASLGLALPAAAAEVNVYTTREPGLIQPLLDAYAEKAGVKVNTVFVKEGLAERVAAEGENSPADILMTVDFGNLIDLVDRGLTQPTTSAAIEAAVPASLRDANGQWTALSLRARVLYVSKDRLPDLKAMTYEDLADPKWKGKVCIRSGQHPYNTSLIAAVIAKDGRDAAKTWLTGLKANLARKASGGDREGARDVLAGLCDVAIGNSYYVGLMRSGKGGPDQQKWAEAINVVLPTFAKSGGTHVNVSGAAVAKNAPNKEQAVKLLEFLVSDEAQGLYAKANFEYPVKPGAPVDPILASFGELKVDDASLAEISKNRKAASALVDEVGFDG
ncbi:iron(III) transport system substrate-binding protein [Methylopila capsulata]|uniref:ABC transporter substrate-binding protein n=1 Tax=Methylopila capsulata TaxID=61654 RepID=A0A9W6MSX9_9HYPH|nr:Fe(3+) ABC transporter substrate-binding protein [Methylopila capsulata]MBM7853550.1 iron(III) transport system substrate-binding protein [Methylopila capsulata]GLK57235.1 ABC transporter substrate-binding protein [Methylopila capsulata]